MNEYSSAHTDQAGPAPAADREMNQITLPSRYLIRTLNKEHISQKPNYESGRSDQCLINLNI